MVLVPLNFLFSSFDDDPLDSMEVAKWPIDTDDSFDTQSLAYDSQASDLIDPFSPSPHSKSYFVDIHARVPSRSPSMSTIRHPDNITVRSHTSVKPPSSPTQFRSPTPLSFLPPPYAQSSTLFNTTKSRPPEVSFLDLPGSKPEKMRRPSFPLLVPPSPSTSIPSPITNANITTYKPFRFRLKPFSKVHRRCPTVTWLTSLFSLPKTTPLKLGRKGSKRDTSNAGVVHSTPNLNDIIPDVIPSNFATSLIKLINQSTGEDQKLRHDYDNCNVRSGGSKVAEWFGSRTLPPRPPPETAPQVMETMRLFETELADEIASLADWRGFCRELLDGDVTNEPEYRS